MYEVAYGFCFVCDQWFGYNVARVPSIPCEGMRRPICQACVDFINVRRIANGLPPIRPLPGAYEMEAS